VKDDDFSAPWQTPVKKIIERAIVIHPAFGSEVIPVKVKKSRVLIMFFEFN
jgi:hypothetical protein